MMCLPVLLFLAITFSALFCMRRYIRLKISIHAEVPVRYSAANGGRVKLEDNKVMARLYAPPSYEDVVTPSKAAMMVPPPAYSTLSARVKAGEVEVIDSEDEMYHLSPSGRRRLEKYQEDRLQVHEGCHDSLSSLDEKSSPRSGRSRRHGRSPKPYKGSHEPHWQLVRGQNFNNGASIRSSDTEDEDERERRNKKKGGKAKRTVPVKRRADDLVAAGQTCTGDGDEGRHLLSTQNNANSPNDLATEAPSPSSVSDECPQRSQCHQSSAYSSRSSPRASRAFASLPPPPTYSNISGDDPPKYEPRDTSRSPSPSHTPSKVHGNTIGSKSSPQPNSPVPQKNKGKPAHGPNLPCVVEINPCSSNPSIPKSSSSSPEEQAPNTCTASPSPSSSSNTDHELSTHSETESRPPSNTNSRTESNGSLADQCVSLMVKEKAQESAATRLV
ncbi:hypothetical protein EGW08_006454 [Elysia chlorotica]|uniref:Uncharacterized protein n=1 Tax=Elysia chlorotica TaxID=188477 RepID=A0A3S1BKE6_ELYCH|nr:hypothetical protein EGW08_006454 [Elysia chlorotica]